MVKIRLSRVGGKKKPFYRVVVTDARSPRDGKFIEIIGKYNPRTEPSYMEVEKDRALHWLARGAKPSQAVDKIFKITGVKKEFLQNKDKYLQEVLK
ncbi:MAG: 30S ribosomal protein S16 [Actinomycetia bacterium]|nr:30S ribosomal protein S16 [Actinomycetes bacterium]